MSQLYRVEPRRVAVGDCRLQSFHAGYAALVASWVRDPREAYWLAPRSEPPLTAARVLEWIGPGRQCLLMLEQGVAAPVGYGEINVLDARTRRYWLGHLIIDGEQRGRGLGIALTRLLLERAFGPMRAREITLVVFPGNVAAIASYRAVGFVDEGEEVHEFPHYGGRTRMLRMSTRALPN